MFCRWIDELCDGWRGAAGDENVGLGVERFGKSSDQSPKSSTARPENELRWHPALCVFFSAVFLGAIPFIVADMDSKKNEALGYTSILVIISFAIGCLWAAFVIAKANRKAWREFQEKGPDTQE